MRRFTIGDVEFEVDADRLSYRATRGARIYNVIGGVGIGLVSAALAYIFAHNQPLTGLLEPGVDWNSVAVWCFAVFAIIMVVAAPMYQKHSTVPLVLNAKDRSMTRYGKKVSDLSAAEEIDLRYCSGMSDEYSVVPAWSVIANGGRGHFPLLSFTDEGDARRAAKEIAAFLGLPVRGLHQ